MKAAWRKTISIPILLALLCIGIYFSWPHILYHIIQRRIVSTIEKLQKEDVEIKYDTLYSSRGKIIIQGLTLMTPLSSDSCLRDGWSAHISKVEIIDLPILPLLLNRVLTLDSLIISNSEIHYAFLKHLNRTKRKNSFEVLDINYLLINKAIINFRDSASCRTSMRMALNLKISNLKAKDINLDSIKWSARDAVASAIQIELPNKFYKIRISKIIYSSIEKYFNVNSIHIIPDYAKGEFALRSGHQTDRVECTIPFIKATGFEIASRPDALFHVRHIKLSLRADISRDKRYPFKNRVKALPVKFLHNLAVHFQIDTVQLFNSYVSYGEILDDGASGSVFFNKLESKIYNVSNISNKEARMESTASLMDAGVLHADFTFPAKANNAYSARGSLTDFSLSKINPILIPEANAAIKSGKLDELKFHFNYNETRADGEVVLNYSDLKMVSLKKNNPQRTINKFLTFVLSLVVKKDMDKQTSFDKKHGTILFYRDPQKSVFNYWWKSILSGIKSVYNLDKISDTDGKK